MNVKILTDSACDMLTEDIERYNVEKLPLYVIQDKNTYKDGMDITPDVVYQKMRRGVHYKTSQIPYSDFLEHFTELAKVKKPCLCLCFSSGLSGTYQAAMLAMRDTLEKFPEAQIKVVDTKAVTGGLGLIVTKVAKAAYEGAALTELLKLARYYSDHICHVFTVTDLEYLYRGGRLNKGTAIVGNMLKIKPLLDVDDNGELRQIDKARGEKKLLKKMIEYLEEKCAHPDKQTIFITHADNEALVETFIKLAGRHLKTDNFEVMPLAPIIGTHSGPGTLAVFFFDEIKE
ncbi:MAG: DegV family protein [Eubacterium sp.]